MVDTYTKCILTIIAITLVILTVDNATKPARAQIGYAKVQICDENNCSQLVPIPQIVQGRTVFTWGVPVVPAR